MLIMSSINVIGVSAIVARAAYFAISRKDPYEEVTKPDLTSDELLSHAYSSGYFAHVSVLDKRLREE